MAGLHEREPAEHLLLGDVAARREQQLTFTGWVSALARERTHALARVARSEGLTSALMGAIVRNAARNLRRRHHRSRPHDVLDDAAAADLPSVDSILARAEEHVRLEGRVNHLAAIQRRRARQIVVRPYRCGRSRSRGPSLVGRD